MIWRILVILPFVGQEVSACGCIGAPVGVIAPDSVDSPVAPVAKHPWEVAPEEHGAFVDFIRGRLGGEAHVAPYEGYGLSVFQDPHKLDCDFHPEKKCCWTNVGQKADELDWAILNAEQVHFTQRGEFRSVSRPHGASLVTGSPRTLNHHQALLLSCPIMCQNTTNRLTISHWLSPGVKLDVCKMEVGHRTFQGQCATTSGTRTSTVDVPPHSKPFYIAIVASGFTSRVPNDGGGLAIIDDIVYNGQLCGHVAGKK